MDITELTQTEVENLIDQLNIRLEQIRLDNYNEQLDRNTRITNAKQTLDTLLGPEDAPPGIDNINGVLGFDGPTMAENAELALPLIVTGLKILAETVRDITEVVSTEN